MDRLTSMRVFAAVTRLGSFAAAADELNISNAMCSKYVRDLEEKLGARLLNRTTRQLSLTEVGSAYHTRVIDILTEVEEAERSVSEMQNRPVGTLRIMAPPSFGAFHIARAVKGYKTKYPEVAIDLLLSDDFDNLVDRGVDLAFRVGDLEDSSVVALPVSSSRLIVCGSPDYFEQNGTPQSIDALKDHICLTMGQNLVFPTHWKFNVDGKDKVIDIDNTYLKANIADALRVAAINGSGLIQLPSYMVGLDIQYGRLTPVLEEFEPAPLPINLVYAHRKHMSLKIRSFVDYMKGFFEDPPYWDKWMYS
ncbi:MAG: LysR family transcriptional regulator [Gammaproteobacteria bacterium]